MRLQKVFRSKYFNEHLHLHGYFMNTFIGTCSDIIKTRAPGQAFGQDKHFDGHWLALFTTGVSGGHFLSWDQQGSVRPFETIF